MDDWQNGVRISSRIDWQSEDVTGISGSRNHCRRTGRIRNGCTLSGSNQSDEVRCDQDTCHKYSHGCLDMESLSSGCCYQYRQEVECYIINPCKGCYGR